MWHWDEGREGIKIFKVSPFFGARLHHQQHHGYQLIIIILIIIMNNNTTNYSCAISVHTHNNRSLFRREVAKNKKGKKFGKQCRLPCRIICFCWWMMKLHNSIFYTIKICINNELMLSKYTVAKERMLSWVEWNGKLQVKKIAQRTERWDICKRTSLPNLSKQKVKNLGFTVWICQNNLTTTALQHASWNENKNCKV